MDDWIWARRCITDKSLLEAASPPSVKVREALLSREDILKLLKFGIIEECTSQPRNTCNVFSVIEELKNRRRMIIEPCINDILLYAGRVELPSLQQVAEEVGTSSHATLFDFASYYNHFPLPEEVRKYYTFSHEGRNYQLMVIATGQRQCPCASQALTRSLVKTAVKNHDSVTGSAYIDNVRFCGSDESLGVVVENFMSTCKKLNICINDDDTIWNATRYVYLGICFDHETRTISLAEKTRTKLQDQSDRFDTCSTLRDAMALLGILVWSLRVMCHPLAHAYLFIKFIRRRVASHELDEIAKVWPCLIQNVKTLIHDILQLPPRRILTNAIDAGIVLFTDACLSGFGCVMFHGENIHITAGPFYHRESINVLETRALLYGIQMLPSQSSLTRVQIYVDNTSAMGSFQKGRSNNYSMNCIIPEMVSILETKNYDASIQYVCSKLNLADHPSRHWKEYI